MYMYTDVYAEPASSTGNCHTSEDSPSSGPPDGDDLSPGAVAGIVVAVLIMCVCAAVAAPFVIKFINQVHVYMHLHVFVHVYIYLDTCMSRIFLTCIYFSKIQIVHKSMKHRNRPQWKERTLCQNSQKAVKVQYIRAPTRHGLFYKCYCVCRTRRPER